jgi:ubiquinol-cytochrome c reductase iron-sulfur subunit
MAAPVLSSGTQSKREVHEINVPDWGHYKREAQEGGESGGRAFSYMVLGTAGVGYAAAAKHTVLKFLDSMNPAANVRAMANVEVDVSNISEGSIMTVKWRGKPLFIRHRTAEEIADAESAPLTDMRDPCPDAARRKADKPEWLIVVGVCTHLGCVPLGGQGEYGGWFCPCHGSHYDTAGRIRKVNRPPPSTPPSSASHLGRGGGQALALPLSICLPPPQVMDWFK